MNIYDISKKAGVSIATVSRVLNDSEHVSEATRKKVLRVMKRNDYTPNAFARGLGLNTMKTIGILCPTSADNFISDAINTCVSKLRENGYDSILMCTGENFEDKANAMEILLNKKVDGMILIGSTFTEMEQEKNQYIKDAADKLPIIMINGFIDHTNIYCVQADDYKAMFDITTKLIAHNKKNILYLYRSLTYSSLEKLKGFEDALIKEKNNFNVNDYIQLIDGDIDEIKTKLSQLYSENIHFDAILTSDDEMAVGALKYAIKNNMSVPFDLSIIGYNNSKLTTCTNPELSSIDSKVKKLATISVEKLLKIIDQEEVERHSFVETTFIERETTSFKI